MKNEVSHNNKKRINTMSKMLILNFAAFDSNKPGKEKKSYYKFDMFDIETKQLLNIFTEQQYCGIPDGVIPSAAECRSGFPKIAEVDFNFNQYTDSDGKVRYSPRVNAILSWKTVDLKKL